MDNNKIDLQQCKSIWGSATKKILISDDEEQYLDVLYAHVQDSLCKCFIECKIVRVTSPLPLIDKLVCLLSHAMKYPVMVLFLLK